MPMTIIYFNTCRRDRLRSARTHTIEILGPKRFSNIVYALQQAYKPTRSPRTNYNYALHALYYVVGLDGLNAISLIKDAWRATRATRATPYNLKDTHHVTLN